MTDKQLNEVMETIEEISSFIYNLTNEQVSNPHIINIIEESMKDFVKDLKKIKESDSEFMEHANRIILGINSFMIQKKKEITDENIAHFNFLEKVFCTVIDSLTYIYIPENSIQIYTELVHENSKIPTYAHQEDACADIYACEDVWIQPNEIAIIDIGLRFAIPIGWKIMIYPRSGLSSKGIDMIGAPGTVDAGYPGNIKISLINTTNEVYKIKAGDRIGQICPEKVQKGFFPIVQDSSKYRKADRTNKNGESGHGSTGN